MEVHVKVGADENGIVKGIKVEALSNAGAYGDHSPTTIGLTGHKAIALYRNLEAYALTMRLSTPTCRHPVHIVDMVPHREFMQWNPLSMSWPIR